MGVQRLDVRIGASPEMVFDFISDIDRWPRWDALAEEITWTSDSPIVLGTRYHERDARGDASQWTVTQWERPRRQRHVGQVPFLGTVTVAMDLEPAGDSTVWHYSVAYRVLPKVRPIGWLIERIYVDSFARRGMVATAGAARDLIERGASRSD